MNDMNNNYSVLMSVYYKENAQYLRRAMDSMWEQTIPTDDFVLVCDGPLTPELDRVIVEMEQQHGDILRVVRLEKNVGLGNALNAGIKKCNNEMVARMDLDDISRQDRCENQLEVFWEKAEVCVVSGVVEEFTASPDKINARRVLPEMQDQILSFARKRNPFNHPCVMYKKSAVEASGGYRDIYLLEDYYLWVRMLQKGSIGYNIQEPLLWMRAGSDMYKRLSGWRYARSQNVLFKYMKYTGFISQRQFIESIFLRTVSALLPNRLRIIFYSRFVR